MNLQVDTSLLPKQLTITDNRGLQRSYRYRGPHDPKQAVPKDYLEITLTSETTFVGALSGVTSVEQLPDTLVVARPDTSHTTQIQGTGTQFEEYAKIGDHSGTFPTTAWTFLRVAKDLPQSEYRSGLNDFIRRYWKPVFYFIRAKGQPVADAEDLTQDFLIDKVLNPEWLAKADRTRGRFRNFLLTTLKGFLQDQSPGRAPRQPSFEKKFVLVSSLVGEEDRRFEPALNETPETIYMKKWARDLMDRAHLRAREWCKDEGMPDWWYEAFAAVHRIDPPSHKTLAQEYGQTPDKLRYALNKVKDYYFRESLRHEVRYQVGPAVNVDDEINELMAFL